MLPRANAASRGFANRMVRPPLALIPHASAPAASAFGLVVERDGVELEPVIDQAVAEPARDLGLQPLDLLRLELDHLAGAQVDQMIVVAVGHLLVARPPVAEI